MSEVPLPSGLWPLWIALIPFTPGGLFIAIPEIELRMSSLGLNDVGPFRELARLAAEG
jgi:hypothetical protein